jgi:hypothetical protein
MFQREALWIDFSGSEECAIKISVGSASLLERWFLPADTASGAVWDGSDVQKPSNVNVMWW